MKNENNGKSNINFDSNIIHSEEYVEGSEVCSSYSSGKCLDKPEKYCDCCASECGKERF